MIVNLLAAMTATMSLTAGLSGEAAAREVAFDGMNDQDGVIATAPRAGVQSVPIDAPAIVSATPSVSVGAESAASPHGLSTDEQINRWLSQRTGASSPDQGWSEGSSRGGYGALLADEDGERRMRGEVSVGVGTGGYRDYAAAVTMPLGENGALSLSISQTKNSPYDAYYPYRYGLSGMDYWGLSRWRTAPGYAPPYRALPLDRGLRVTPDRREEMREGRARDDGTGRNP